MVEFLHSPGFLGTKANWAADFTLVMGLVVAGLLIWGVRLVRRGEIGLHRVVQTTAVILNIILVAWLMILPYFSFVAPPSNPALLPRVALWVTKIHALVGSSGLLFGTFVMLRGNGLMIKPLQFTNYRLFMRISYFLYMLATLIGIFVYITWFVTNPGLPPSYE